MKRIRARYGAVTEDDVRAMMDRPVSKKMNLHCVLFLPERLSFQFAHAVGARHTECFQACRQPYTTIDLTRWLDERIPSVTVGMWHSPSTSSGP